MPDGFTPFQPYQRLKAADLNKALSDVQNASRAVTSVAGKVGDVVLFHTDISDWTAATGNYQSGAQVQASIDASWALHQSTVLPLMDGTAASGTSLQYAPQDHVHPTDTSRYDASNPANYQSASQVATSLTSYVPLTSIAVPSGVASLDATGRIPGSQLPAAATGTLNYVGGWNAVTNVPLLATGGRMGGVVQPKGNYYLCTVANATISPAIDGITAINAGDWMVANGTTWERLQNGTSPYLPLIGGSLSGALSIMSSATISGQATDPRQPGNIVRAWADQNGNWGAYIIGDGSWMIPTLTTKVLTSTTATFGTVTTTTETVGNLTATIFTASGGSPSFDGLTIKGGAIYSTDPRNPIAKAWADGAGNIGPHITSDGTLRTGGFGAALANITTANITNLNAPNFSLPSMNLGASTITANDPRYRQAEIWADNANNAALTLNASGSLSFTPASGILAKYLQSRIERQHMMTQGPPSHSASASTVGTSNTTYHLTATLDSNGFDCVRLVIPVIRTPQGGTIKACIAVSASAADPINPKDASGNPVNWMPVTFASAGRSVNWEDQPYGSIQLTTTNVFTPQGSNTLTFTTSPITAGVVVGMFCYIPAFATGAAGIPLTEHWALVTGVTDTTVTISKQIQNMWNSAGSGNNGLPVSWPVFFSPTTFTLPGYKGVPFGESVNLYVSDWMPKSSLDRSDGGRFPIVMVRVYANGTHNTLVTNLSNTSPAWGGLIGDRLWASYTQVGDFATDGTQSGFIATTDNGTMIVGWLQYYSRSRGSTVMFVGDSITQGINGPIDGVGGLELAALQLSTPACPVTNVGMVNGWNSAGVGEFIYTTCLTQLDIFQPSVMAIAGWTQNGEFNVPPIDFPPFSQDVADWYWQQCLRLSEKARRRYNTQTIYFPPPPSAAFKLTPPTDAVRMSSLLRARQANASGEMYIDTDNLLGIPNTSPVDTYYPGLHPPPAAQMILSLDVMRQYKTSLGV